MRSRHPGLFGGPEDIKCWIAQDSPPARPLRGSWRPCHLGLASCQTSRSCNHPLAGGRKDLGKPREGVSTRTSGTCYEYI